MLGTDLGSVDTKWEKVPNFYPLTHSCHCPKSNFCTYTSIFIFNEPNIFSQINISLLLYFTFYIPAHYPAMFPSHKTLAILTSLCLTLFH